MITLTFFIFLAIYIVFILKFLLLEQLGQETTATITSRIDDYMSGAEARQRSGFLKALIGRHKLYYRFDPANGPRGFGQAPVDDFTFENTLIDDQVPVLYLPQFPALNCLKSLLLTRFQEMVKIGGIYIMIYVFLFGLQVILAGPPPTPEQLREQEKIEHWMTQMEKMQDDPKSRDELIKQMQEHPENMPSLNEVLKQLGTPPQ